MEFGSKLDSVRLLFAMASSSATAKVALDKVAWEFVQDECTAKEQVVKSLQDRLKDFED